MLLEQQIGSFEANDAAEQQEPQDDSDTDYKPPTTGTLKPVEGISLFTTRETLLKMIPAAREAMVPFPGKKTYGWVWFTIKAAAEQAVASQTKDIFTTELVSVKQRYQADSSGTSATSSSSSAGAAASSSSASL
uniref:Uncharacterized protein n=1 Tax=Chromera velia CCMP2878 TaxID=1169474 RepID=A0A0G4HKB9_9ALVE|eukprot:Cvel_28579.t1-p1 / transcript=Cvel_28579.t1 / gene=Cvel_28579 / organism=Chromera_velia_CCMP2878 / gene_product=hypothetical protein / transcript_product=hypothetical protein / location=Cvel_scaffold3766:3812-10804(+) / protein_length=133 / sequence_SO=supercontig / SO=protein_coding / is_pseudo=false